MIFAASTFVEALLVCMIALPIAILWVAAIVCVVQDHHSGWALAGWLLVIVVFPLIGVLLYFAFRPKPDVDVDAAYAAQADARREAASRPIGGTGLHR